MRAALAGLACLALGACSSGVPEAAPVAAAPAPKPDVVPCAKGKAWTPAERRALADALTPVPANSAIWTLETDWQSYADQARACSAAQAKP